MIGCLIPSLVVFYFLYNKDTLCAFCNVVLSSFSFKFLYKLFLSSLQRLHEDPVFSYTEGLADPCWRGNRKVTLSALNLYSERPSF